MNVAAIWPYALAAVLVLAAIILILLVVVLRKSAKASKFPDPNEPPAPEEPAASPDTTQQAVPALGGVFRRARRRMRQTRQGDPHELPLMLLIGAAGSRDSNLLATAGLDLPFGTATDAETSLAYGRGFWLYDRGVVLDVAGDMILRADGSTADDSHWAGVLRRLQKLRPKRPIDGIIVTISCQTLLDAVKNELARTDLAVRMGKIHRRIADVQQKLGFRVPAYIVVTGSEALVGFNALCSGLPPQSRRQMLGWSSTYTTDATYSPEWVDEAFAALNSRVQDLQMEIFTEGSKDANTLLLLDEAVLSLAAPMRTCLDQLFRATAYHDAPVLRGIYLTGKDTGETDVLGQSSGGTAFLGDLLERKAFPEWGVATPTTWTLVTRNRTVQIAQIATIVLGILFAGGTALGTYRMHKSNTELLPFLEATADRVEACRAQGQQISDGNLQSWSLDLLRGMARIDFSHYAAIFIPSSWISDYDARIERAITESFETVILDGVRLELEERARRLLDGSYSCTASIVESQSEPSTRGFALEDAPQFRELRQLVFCFRELEDTKRRFNDLSRTADIKELGIVVKSAFGQDLPAEFYVNNHLYRRALRNANYARFDAARFRDEANLNAAKLAHGFYNSLFEQNLFYARLRELGGAIGNAATEWPSAGETGRFSELVSRMREIETAAATPQMEWAFRPTFSLGRDFDRVLVDMETSEFFGRPAAVSLRNDATAAWREYQRRLAGTTSPLTGSILAVDRGRPTMQLSSDTLLLKSALETFLGQKFVTTPSAQRHIQVRLLPGTRLVWSAPSLAQAADVVQAYDRFRDKTFPLIPADLRISVDQVARDRARAQMMDLLAQAQQFENVLPPATRDAREEAVRSDVTTFVASTKSIESALDGLTRLNLVDDKRDVTLAMTAEARRILAEVDELLEAEQPYRPRQGGFEWWNGDAPPTPAAWGAADAAEVTLYLNTTRERIAYIGRTYAHPLLAFLAHEGTRATPESRRWQNILDDLRDYDAKKPGNAVAMLEDYVLERMAKIDLATCGGARLPAGFQPDSGIFATRTHELSSQLTARCTNVAIERVATRYREIEQYFNQRLAGRYPFTDGPPRAGELEADPNDLRGFFRIFDASQAMVRSIPVDATQDPSFAKARRFVEDLAAVRVFFATYLEKPEAGPAIDIEPMFRVLRDREVYGDQIIGWTLDVGRDTITNRETKARKLRWTYGEPVRVSLRWASESPRIPVAGNVRPGVTVLDRTVTYEYRNAWALLSALAQNQSSADDLPSFLDVEPVTLSLEVPTRNAVAVQDEQPSDARVFLRLSVLDPKSAQPLIIPRFPSSAPRIGGAAYTTEARK
ncbi:MAG TPA: type VI secretion protein IcmF/TssM N-terminal domain-containing protein [Thermoanaerobaculia bacterium]|jgi:type VI secretion system protein ImpL|nr:type VI secretion protein IcmF/TssM N-terminal domain-containing protein [Thermoanaerobaculia bacterium]